MEYKININPIEGDSLDRTAYLTTLCHGIEEFFDNTESTKFDGNVFLIDGERGSGKSRVIKHMKNEIKSNRSDVDVIEFSARQYLDEKELITTLCRQLFAKTQQENAAEVVRNKINFIISVARLIPYIWRLVNPYIPGMIDYINSNLDTCGDDILYSFSHKLEQIFVHKDQIGMSMELGGRIMDTIAKIQWRLKDKIVDETKQIENIKDIKFAKTIIILEDLDRMQYEKLRRILSVLSIFSDNKELLFVLVGSSRYLEAIMEEKYHVPHEGENFIAKFISVRYKLPPFTKSVAIKQLLHFFQNDLKRQIDAKLCKSFLERFFLKDMSYRAFKTQILESFIKNQSVIQQIEYQDPREKVIMIVIMIYFMTNKTGEVAQLTKEIITKIQSEEYDFAQFYGQYICYLLISTGGHNLEEFANTNSDILEAMTYILVFRNGLDNARRFLNGGSFTDQFKKFAKKHSKKDPQSILETLSGYIAIISRSAEELDIKDIIETHRSSFDKQLFRTVSTIYAS